MANIKQTTIIQADASNAVRTIADLKAEVKQLKAELDNCAVGSQEATLKSQALSQAQTELKAAMKGAIDEVQHLDNSYNGLVAQMASLKAAQHAVDLSTEEGKKRYAEMAVEINGLNDQLKSLDAQNGVFTRNVGNYVGALNTVLSSLGTAGISLGKFGNYLRGFLGLAQALPVLNQMVESFKGLNISVKAASLSLKGLKTALISTGIGAAVVAVGALAANWERVVNAVKKWKIVSTETEERLEREKKRIEGLREELAKLEQNYDEWLRNEKYSKLNEVAKKQYDDLAKSIEGATKKLEVLKLQHETGVNGGDATDWFAEVAAIEALENEIENLQNKQTAILDNAKNYKKITNTIDDLKAAYAALSEEIKDYNKTEKQIELSKLDKEEQQKIDLIKKAQKKRLVNEENAEKQILEIQEHYAKLRKDVEKKYNAELERLRASLLEKYLSDVASAMEEEIKEIEAGYDKKAITIEEKEAMIAGVRDKYRKEALEEYNLIYDDEKLEEELAALTEKFDLALLTEEQYLIASENLRAKYEEGTLEWTKVGTAAFDEMWKHATDKKKAKTAMVAFTEVGNAVSDMLSGIAANFDENSKEYKGLMITSTIISMMTGIAQAVSQAMELGPIAGPIIGAINAATVTATGIASIAKIKSANANSSASGSSSSSSGSSVSSSVLQNIVAPVEYAQATTASAEEAARDTRVYVSETDITSTQNRVSVAESEARF